MSTLELVGGPYDGEHLPAMVSMWDGKAAPKVITYRSGRCHLYKRQTKDGTEVYVYVGECYAD